MIHFENFEKGYDSSPELLFKIPDLELQASFYWIKGGNGEGKTTLIRCIAGLLPFQGNIMVDGIDLRKETRQYRLFVNLAEAEPQYPSFLTGSDLVNLYAYTKKATPQDTNRLITGFSVANYLRDPIGSYSTGMRKKLSLVLGFMGNPKLILLDEPFITLDKQAAGFLATTINQHLQNGVQIVIASHQETDTNWQINPQSLLINSQTLVVEFHV